MKFFHMKNSNYELFPNYGILYSNAFAISIHCSVIYTIVTYTPCFSYHAHNHLIAAPCSNRRERTIPIQLYIVTHDKLILYGITS